MIRNDAAILQHFVEAWSKSGAVLTLEIASTVALTGNTDYLHILTQVEAVLI